MTGFARLDEDRIFLMTRIIASLDKPDRYFFVVMPLGHT